jgi:polyphosphate kinase 2 (PPK2 family)|tara:strand:+ start:536 stop:1177 length:642 start_codon:yes stop_codon:yes gene_type:complete
MEKENIMTKLEMQQIMLNQLVEKDFGKVAIILEGRDTAGKTGTIRELTHYLPINKYAISLSTKPSKGDMNDWLESWERKMPGNNQIVFYDRSWYSRAMVQKMNSWCTDAQYDEFMAKVLKWEVAQKDVKFIKCWLSISEAEQTARINNRKVSPLTKWKFSPNDALALSGYDQMTLLKERVHTTLGKWHDIDYNVKSEGRLSLITKIVEILSHA